MATTRSTVIGVSALLGLLSFPCQWLYILGLGTAICESLTAWWLVPVLASTVIAGALGYLYPAHSKTVFPVLMLPSIAVRQLSFFFMEGGPGNLWPMFFVADLLLLAFVWIVMKVAVRLAQSSRAPTETERSKS